MMHDSPYIIPLQQIRFDGSDFLITVAEVQKQVPFAVERVYWLTTQSAKANRGNHAHVNSSQVLVAVQGDLRVKIIDRQGASLEFGLTGNGDALYVPPGHWLSIDMPEHAVLLCLSSHRFADQATIYDYHEFIREQ